MAPYTALMTPRDERAPSLPRRQRIPIELVLALVGTAAMLALTLAGCNVPAKIAGNGDVPTDAHHGGETGGSNAGTDAGTPKDAPGTPPADAPPTAIDAPLPPPTDAPLPPPADAAVDAAADAT